MRQAIPFLGLAVLVAGLALVDPTGSWADDPGGNPALSYFPATPNNVTVEYDKGCTERPACINKNDWEQPGNPDGCVTPWGVTVSGTNYQSFNLVRPIAFGYCETTSSSEGETCCKYDTRPCYEVKLRGLPNCMGVSLDWVIHVKNACPPDPNDPASTACAS